MRPLTRSLPGRLLGLVLLLSGGAAVAEVSPVFEPACLPWSSAQYLAEKYFLSIEIDLRARVLDRPPLAELWPVEGRAGLMPGDRTLALEVGTRGPGRRTLDGEMLLDARTGGILQYSSLRGPTPRFRVYRFTGSGPMRWTAEPGPGEEQVRPRDWTDVDVRQWTYAVGTVAEPVIEVSTLLYLLAASGLKAPGDALRVTGYATSADELYTVTATVGPEIRLPVDYRMTGAGAPERRREVVPLLPIRVEGQGQSGAATDAGFEILGLSDVEFLLDPDRRVIAALRARMPAVGQVEFRLRTLERTEPAAHCGA